MMLLAIMLAFVAGISSGVALDRGWIKEPKNVPTIFYTVMAIAAMAVCVIALSAT